MHRNEESVETKRQRIAEKACKEPDFKFTSLFHLMKVELLHECFCRLKEDAAAGIDGVIKAEYAENLKVNLEQLQQRLHQMKYIPQAVRRVYIPKAGSQKMRPLGIAALEDKLVQSALANILQMIYEQDFIDDSYGFRPKRSCHNALRSLNQTVANQPINHIVEADIRGFFDNVDQKQLMAFLSHRIGDTRVLRYIKRFLRAGIQEDGRYRASDLGVPQGGSISPLLANIYLHYTLDLWFEKRFKRSCRGYTRLIRYADDFVVCFQTEYEAQQFRVEMEARLNQFGLEIAPEKTKILAFGPLAQQKARNKGSKAETFDFLGFTHYCSRTRDGNRFRMKRKTITKRLTAKLKMMNEWLCKNRTLPTAQIMKTVRAKLQGHFAYYGVTDNSSSINCYAGQVTKLLNKWFNRRGKRGCCNWDKFRLLLGRYPLPRPCIKVNLF